MQRQPNPDLKSQRRAAVRARRAARALADTATEAPSQTSVGAGEAEAAAPGGRQAGETERFAEVLAEVLAAARSVIGYAALAGEPNIDLALDRAHAAGAHVLLPVVTPSQPLGFGLLSGPMAGLPRRGKWQIREPDAAVSAAEALAGSVPHVPAGTRAASQTGVPDGTPSLPPADILLVPGLSFSRAGVRLGNGGGFYDRTFGPQGEAPVGPLPVRVFGVCFHEEIADSLPVDAWDLRVEAVVTEQGVVPVE